MIKRLIILIAWMSIPLTSQAEDTVIFSYARTSQMPAQWAVMPMVTDLPDAQPMTLFESLRRKKMPTYGTSMYLPQTNVVQMDDSKCAYGSIISAEIGMTFEAHGHAVPKVICDGRPVAESVDSLTHFVSVVPLWQALQGTKIDAPALVRVGNEYLSPAEFQNRLKKQDKALVRAIEAEFGNPNIFAKTGAMKGYIQGKFPGAEKRVARELGSMDTGVVSAAMAALSGTHDASIIAQMKGILQKDGENREAYAASMLSAADDALRDEAARVLLKSADDAQFNRALSEGGAATERVIAKNLSEILSAATPEHARILTQKAFSMKAAGGVGEWLMGAANTDTAQAVAETASRLGDADNVRNIALGMLLQNSNPDLAYDALDSLVSMHVKDDGIWKRGIQSVHPWIRLESADHLSEVKPETVLGASLWELALTNSEKAVTELHAHLYDTDPAVRRDVAGGLRWIDTSGDALRLALLKDSDESVVISLIRQISQRPADEVSPALVKEITSRSTGSAAIKMAVLFALPRVMNEKTTKSIMAYAGNEMFDENTLVRIAAIRALGEISHRTNDPVIADNARTSLALTVQDRSESIVHHTKKALSEKENGH